MKKINVKNILIIMLIAIEVIATYFMYKSGTNKEVVLDNVELKELTDNNSFAIYLDGKEYTSSTTWPESAAFQKAECQNEKGDIVTGVLTFNEEENKAYVKNITQTTYCYLYFKSCNGPVGTVLANKDKVSSCEVGGMYRYQGTDNVNNYICFGTTNQSTCTSNASKYMYRIIGVTPDNQLKLILADFLREDSSEAILYDYWDYNTYLDSTKYVWSNARLFRGLNGIEINSRSNFINNTYYDYLSNPNWLNLIDTTHTWKYGEISNSSKITYNGYEVYDLENNFSDTVQASIGLPYIHDFLLSYPGGNPGNYTNAAKSWMDSDLSLSSFGYWTMTKNRVDIQYPTSGDVKGVVFAYGIAVGGTIAIDDYDFELHTRPVFYLTPGVTFKEGTTGEKTNPYIINGITDTPAPTCSFNVTTSGVTLVPSNATSWYMSTYQTSRPSYGTETSTSDLGENTYYGYVQNAFETTGTCQLEMYRATAHGCTESSSSTSGGGYTCQVTTYFCDGRATTSERPYSCNGPQGCNGCTGNVNCAIAGVDGYSCCNATYSAGTTTYYCSNGSSCTTSGCCSSMFCGSDNCRSGYTAIEYDNYTRYCYK